MLYPRAAKECESHYATPELHAVREVWRPMPDHRAFLRAAVVYGRERDLQQRSCQR